MRQKGREALQTAVCAIVAAAALRLYQFAAVTVLTPFAFTKNDAIAFIFVLQALMYIVIGVWGTLGILRYRQGRQSA